MCADYHELNVKGQQIGDIDNQIQVQDQNAHDVMNTNRKIQNKKVANIEHKSGAPNTENGDLGYQLSIVKKPKKKKRF